MNRRVKMVLLLGALAAALIMSASRYLVWQNRYKTRGEIISEERDRQWAEDLAAMRSQAKTDDEKLLINYYERTYGAVAWEKARTSVRLDDGVDRFEAWILAQCYLRRNFGLCGMTQIPERDGNRWSVRMAYGSTARPGMIFIDSQKGTITCDVGPTVSDPSVYLKPAK